MIEFKRKPPKSRGISDVWVPNPPPDCPKRVVIQTDGNRYVDIVICAFKCISQCSAYWDHENDIIATRRRLKAGKLNNNKEDKDDTTEAKANGQTYRRRR